LEFREEVVRVARSREPGARIKDIAAYFRISESRPTNWMTRADRDEGVARARRPMSRQKNRELRRRVRLLEQENEVLRRAAAYLSQSNLPGRCTRSSLNWPATRSPSR
jgi:transposase-like protein